VADVHHIKFYPVGNGDTTQIIMASGKRILFDFCHRPKSEEEDTPEINLKSVLKSELDIADKHHFDVVAFTHADLDHIQGSTDFFWLDHAKIYHGDERIKIKELWVPAAMVIEKAEIDQQSEEFVILRQEARHRIIQGEGIKVFSKPPELMEWLEPILKARGEAANARDYLFVDAGTLVPGFDLVLDKIEFFCHSPFIEHCEGGDIIRNSAALVFNVRLRADGYDYDYLEVGDAEWCDIQDIVSTTRYHKNDDRLKWDLYNIPHHGSYKALSDEKGATETIPKDLVKDLLLEGKEGAYIVSCSKQIPDIKDSYDQIQPPHIQARKAYERYLQQVKGRKFLVTMEEPNANKPKPIIFEIGSTGISWLKPVVEGAPAIISSTAPRAGLCQSSSIK
jgi:hypothetical protein